MFFRPIPTHASLWCLENLGAVAAITLVTSERLQGTHPHTPGPCMSPAAAQVRFARRSATVKEGTPPRRCSGTGEVAPDAHFEPPNRYRLKTPTFRTRAAWIEMVLGSWRVVEGIHPVKGISFQFRAAGRCLATRRRIP